MDLDAFVAANRPHWDRLDALLRRRRLTAAEADEVLDLYQRTSTHLSVVRTESPDPALVQSLSGLITRARVVTGSTRTSSTAEVARFFLETFPALLYRTRRWWLATLVVNVLVAFAVGAYVAGHPETYAQVLTKDQIDQLVYSDFEGYYSEYAHHEFAASVWINNAWVSAQCIVFGVLGFPVVSLLWNNILNVGVIGALMAENDRLPLFFGLILPHGLLELTCVFVAGGTGLRLFWSWIVPGAMTRMQSFAQAGRQAIAVAIGLAAVLMLCGAIEGFVTPSGLPPWLKLVIGALAEGGFFAYVFTLGRRAARAGVTGDLGRRDIGDVAPVAA